MFRERELSFADFFARPYIDTVYARDLAHRTARGIDHLGVESFERSLGAQLDLVARKCRNGTYRFAPYLEGLRLKDRFRKPRLIAQPTVRDKLVQILLKEYLHALFPTSVNRTLPNEHIRQLKQFIGGVDASQYLVIRADLTSFYDSIPRAQLLETLYACVSEPPARRLLHSCIVTPIVPTDSRRSARRQYRTASGVPQGLPVSNILADIYMQEFDAEMRGLGRFYTRYVDDILLVVAASDIASAKSAFEDSISALGLSLNSDKTRMGTPLSAGLEFLGYHVQPPDVGVRRPTVERFIRSVAAMFSGYRHRSRAESGPDWMSPELRRRVFIDRLNEKLTGAVSENRKYGWLFYFIEITDTRLLRQLDGIVAEMFSRLPDFSGAPPELKRMVRAFYEAKHNPSGSYIQNYNRYSTVRERLNFLLTAGEVDPEQADRLTEEEVHQRFEVARRRRLRNLERDVGRLS